MRKTSVVLAILFSLSATGGTEAQGIGSAIKKKVTQAVNPQTGAPAQQATQQSGSKLGFTLTDAVMLSLEKGMALEIRMRKDYTDSLIGLKTRDEFFTCEGQIQASPEGMAIQDAWADRMDKATTQADMEKAMAWMADTLTVIVTRACGANPTAAYDAQKDEFKKAHDAGAAEFLTAFQPGVSVTAFAYGVLQEWAVPFYQLSPAAQQQAAANGLSIPGSGTNIFYVYTAQEATLLIAHKATLEPLLQALI